MTGYEQRRQDLIARLHDATGSLKLKKTTSNLFRYRPKGTHGGMDARRLNHVLNVDPKSRTAEVEGMTTYETLLRATLRHSLAPAVVPELKSITVGGAFTGIGIETSSFLYGLVHETFLEIEVLLGDGTIVTASPSENADLFHGFPNTYGTLGYVLKAKLMLVPTQNWVEIVRQRYTGGAQFLDAMSDAGRQQRELQHWNFIEGLIFAGNENYLTLGRFVEEAPYVSDYTFMDIYYKSIRNKEHDYLTAFDYFFRYDTDWFWGSQYFGLENRLLRFLWGKRNLRSDKYWKLMNWERKHQFIARLYALLGKRTESLIQDAEVPAPQAYEFISWFHEQIGMTPLLAAPVQTYREDVRFTLSPIEPGRQYMNVGFYAPLPTTKPDGYYNRLIEKKLIEMGVRKLLYSQCFYTEDEFWMSLDSQAYTDLKRKYDPAGKLPDLYSKCVLRE
jgi:FAD/FMN-containing dehydrogenase